jgi:hypothetical protein
MNTTAYVLEYLIAPLPSIKSHLSPMLPINKTDKVASAISIIHQLHRRTLLLGYLLLSVQTRQLGVLDEKETKEIDSNLSCRLSEKYVFIVLYLLILLFNQTLISTLNLLLHKLPQRNISIRFFKLSLCSIGRMEPIVQCNMHIVTAFLITETCDLMEP